MPSTLFIGKDVRLATKYQAEFKDHQDHFKAVPNIDAGIELAAQDSFNLIIFDPQLLKTEDGLGGLKRLRQDPATKDIPILILPI